MLIRREVIASDLKVIKEATEAFVESRNGDPEIRIRAVGRIAGLLGEENQQSALHLMHVALDPEMYPNACDEHPISVDDLGIIIGATTSLRLTALGLDPSPLELHASIMMPAFGGKTLKRAKIAFPHEADEIRSLNEPEALRRFMQIGKDLNIKPLLART